MKIPAKTISKNGFTLVELLVVIAIIAVLAAAGFTMGNAAKEKAKRTSAQAAATSLVKAIDEFYSEYSALPDVGAAEVNTGNGTLLNILAGREAGPNIQNDRKIRFLSMKEAKNGNQDGLVYNAAGTLVEGLYDPWGQPYNVVLDIQYDERLEFTAAGTAVVLNGRRAAAYSTGGGTLVKSW